MLLLWLGMRTWGWDFTLARGPDIGRSSKSATAPISTRMQKMAGGSVGTRAATVMRKTKRSGLFGPAVGEKLGWAWVFHSWKPKPPTITGSWTVSEVRLRNSKLLGSRVWDPGELSCEIWELSSHSKFVRQGWRMALLWARRRSNSVSFRIWDPGDYYTNTSELSGVVLKDNSRHSTKHEVKKEGSTGHCTWGTTRLSCLPIVGSGLDHRKYYGFLLVDYCYSNFENNPRMLSGLVSNSVMESYPFMPG